MSTSTQASRGSLSVARELHSLMSRLTLGTSGASHFSDEFEGVSEVEYDYASKRILTISAHAGYKDAIGAVARYTRTNVIRSIQAGVPFIMLHYNEDGSWSRGPRIFVALINGEEYLKLASDNEEGDLMEFAVVASST